jgi:hypothetical protein
MEFSDLQLLGSFKNKFNESNSYIRRVAAQYDFWKQVYYLPFLYPADEIKIQLQ